MAKTKAENELRVPEGLHRAVGFWIEDYRRVVSDDDSEDLAQQLRQTGRLWAELGSNPTSFIVKREPEPRYVPGRLGRPSIIETACILDQYQKPRLPNSQDDSVPQLRIYYSGIVDAKAVPTEEILEQASFKGLSPRVALERARVLRQKLVEKDETLGVHSNRVWWDENKRRTEYRCGGGIEITWCDDKAKAHGLSFEGKALHVMKERLADPPERITSEDVDALFDFLNGLEVRRNRR